MGQNSVVDTNSPTIVKPAQPVITNVIPPKDKETTITADHHVTKYVARVPEDATEDQMAKVVSKLREKLAPKQALRPQSATMGPNGIVQTPAAGGVQQPTTPAIDPATSALEAQSAQAELRQAEAEKKAADDEKKLRDEERKAREEKEEKEKKVKEEAEKQIEETKKKSEDERKKVEEAAKKV